MPIAGVEPIDLGGGHKLTPYVSGTYAGITGYIEDHPDLRDPSKVCSGSIALEGSPHAKPGQTWRVVQADPLTLEPSILCRACGNHGWVRNGRWESA